MHVCYFDNSLFSLLFPFPSFFPLERLLTRLTPDRVQAKLECQSIRVVTCSVPNKFIIYKKDIVVIEMGGKGEILLIHVVHGLRSS